MASHKIFYVFRHGETDWNAEGRFQGHTDVPLNDRGRGQARELLGRLKPTPLQVLLSSDLSRARETAEIVARGMGLTVHVDERLREAFLGEAQGMTYQEILDQFGEDVTGRWRSDHPTDADVSYPGGETGAEVMSRVFTALIDFVAKHPEWDHIGVACHGGVIRRVMQKLRPPGSDPVRIPNVVLYRIGYDLSNGGWTIL